MCKARGPNGLSCYCFVRTINNMTDNVSLLLTNMKLHFSVFTLVPVCLKDTPICSRVFFAQVTDVHQKMFFSFVYSQHFGFLHLSLASERVISFAKELIILVMVAWVGALDVDRFSNLFGYYSCIQVFPV